MLLKEFMQQNKSALNRAAAIAASSAVTSIVREEKEARVRELTKTYK